MPGRYAGVMACHFLSLIIFVQIPLASTAPYFHDAPRKSRSLDDISIFTVTTCSDDGPSFPTEISVAAEDNYEGPLDIPDGRVVYQIADGQIQAPDQISPGQISPHQICIATTTSAAPQQLISSSSTRTALTTRGASTQSSAVPALTAAYDALVSSFSTSISDSLLISLETSEVQSASLAGPTSTSGTVGTALQTSGQVASQPFATYVPSATSSLSTVNPSTMSGVQPSATSVVTQLSVSDIFRPISTNKPVVPDAPSGHPVPRTGIQSQSRRLQTNKFYTSLFMDQQTSPVYTFPYSISWAGGKGELASWGMAVSHAEPAQWAKADGMGPKDAGQWAFFGAPVGIQSVILSASELVQTSSANRSRTPGLTTDNIEWGSVKANLFAPGWVTPTISFPLVQGSAFVTGEYHWAKPLIQSSIRFRKVTFAGALPGNTTYKYKAVLRNNQEWLIYITPLSPTYEVNRFDLDATGSSINGPSGFNGFIQVAKVPRNEGLGGLSRRQDPSVSTSEAIYDVSAGVYPTGVNITGDVSGTTGSYTLSWVKNGTQGIELLMFALPHHVASMTSPNRDAFTTLQLSTTTKGLATAIKGDSWTMTESDLPISMEFAPWRPGQDDIKDKLLNKEVVVKAMQTAGAFELKQNIGAQTNVSSAYFDGKALAKFAAVCYALHQLANDTLLALSGLQPLQQAFADHIDNKQTWPLVYDDSWGGVVSSAAYATGNPLEDFGNTYYNDHHFHYGYFVYAAAVIGFLDPTWLTSRNVDWVNMLVRDFAGSDVDDPYFPFSRSFDWYHGHSWAAGLFDSSDGKNQESSSEDTMASYAIKMWGQVSGDQHMEARGNLMLAIQKRSLASYYLYQDDNTVQPSAFIGNKAAGILFENKIDHTTYFGAVPEYIQGIHMIPILPFSTYIRTPELVTQEWAAYFSNLTSTSDGDVNYIDTINSGWRGILMANYAMCNQTAAKDSYQFFANSTFNKTFLDGGASQTWYLAWSAAFADEELSSAE